jgi:soluble lytic murein transglycosylase-like protein
MNFQVLCATGIWAAASVVPAFAGAAMPSACPEAVNDATTIRAAIEKEAAAQNVDVNLALAIADQETLFGRKLNAERSLDKGARGPMQLMPATAERFGVKDACDLNENIRGGVAYLKELSAQFGGNVIFVASAYNAGEGRVIQAGGVPPFAETVRYAASVANIYYRYDNALRGGSRAKARAPEITASALPDSTTTQSIVAGVQKWIGGSVLYVEGED